MAIFVKGGGGGGGAADGNDAVKVSANDTTAGFLNGKLVAGTNITFTEGNDGGNETLTIAAAGGVTGFTGSQNTASPNNTVNASRLLVSATSTNADAVIQPKGTGALLAQLPDNAVTGGDKRGANAVDLQTTRTSSFQVASGPASFVVGDRSRGHGSGAISMGFNNSSGGTRSIAIGESNTASTNNTIAIGLSCTASSTSSIAIGTSNTGSGSYGVAIGQQNTASGTNSVALGKLNTASAGNAVAIGEGNTASSPSAFAFGYLNSSSAAAAFTVGYQALANRHACFVHAAGAFAVAGDGQYERYIIRRATTDATPTILSCDGGAPATATRIGIASDATYTFRAMVTARRTDADNESAGWEVKGVIDNNAGTTALVGSVTVTAIGDDSAGTWTVAVTADNTNDALQFEVTGEAGKTIRWGATVELMKVAG